MEAIIGNKWMILTRQDKYFKTKVFKKFLIKSYTWWQTEQLGMVMQLSIGSGSTSLQNTHPLQKHSVKNVGRF